MTDLVLLDVKYTNAEDYRRHVGCELAQVESFLSYLQEQGIATWLRHVLIPGYNDNEESLSRLVALRDAHSCVRRVELLPFRKLCLEKYREMGIPFALEDTPEMPADRTEELRRKYALN